MASFKYNNVYLNNSYSVVGPYEKKGNIKKYDEAIDDFYGGESTLEKCEVKMQEKVINGLLEKSFMPSKDIDLVVGGDLLNQISITSYNMRNYDIPFLGLYGACATFLESLIILSNFIEAGQIKNGIAITSSHNLNSEKQFRFPIEYGSPKPDRTTFTATGAVGCTISAKKSNVKVKSATIGRVVDYGIKDPYNLGAAMAPACADVIRSHLNDLNLKPKYYDLILTGDLGVGGAKILKRLLESDYGIILKNHLDAGTLIYKKEQETYDGASGPIALPLVLFNKILKDKKYKNILIVGTGAMHSPVMLNQKDSVPGISYAVSLEVK